MFTLHLDLHLKFVPPMREHGPGIVLTLAVQLPFVPASSLHIAGASLDEHGGPMGFCLEELTWDVDREVFFASTQIICHDEPLALIPDTIRSWLDLGWELGSYADTYEQPDDGDDTIELEDDGEYERLEVLHTLPKTMPRSDKPLEVYAEGQQVRSIHGASYTRLHNVDLLTMLREFATDFTPPQESGAPDTKGANGLYCGEQDMFCFLIDPTGWTEINGEAFAPGFFVWNSEGSVHRHCAA